MSTTSKNKILLITVAILLLTNFVMLFLFLNKGPEKRGLHGGRDGMLTEFLKNDVGFNPQQLQQYDTLSKQHREKLKASFDEIRNSRSDLFKELGKNAFSDSAINMAADKSASIQKQMEISMMTHIREIRNLCTPGQQPKFDSLFYKVWNRKRDDKGKPGH
jgi:Spy/CpxP family protein refolding chaperone